MDAVIKCFRFHIKKKLLNVFLDYVQFIEYELLKIFNFFYFKFSIII